MLNLYSKPFFLFLFFGALLLPTVLFANHEAPAFVSNPSACGIGAVVNDQSCPNSGLSLPIDVLAAPGTSLGTDVYLKSLKLIIQHDWVSDLDIFLVAPDGTMVEVSTDNGGGGDNYGIVNGVCDSATIILNSLFSDACQSPGIKGQSAPFLGEFLPEGDFADFHNGQNPNGQWSLEVCDDSPNNFGKVEFVELVFENANCIPAYNINVADISTAGISLDWEQGLGVPLDTVFEYGPVGFLPGQGLTTNGGTLAVTNPIQNLAPNETYDIYVRLECQPGVYTINSCPITVTTPCYPTNPTLSENFDTQNACNNSFGCNNPCDIAGLWENVSGDDMNWLVRSGSSPTSQTGPSGDVEGGGQYAYLETTCFGNGFGDSTVLLSDLIHIDTLTNACELTFNYHLFGTQINALRLDISTDCGDNWTALFEEAGNQGNFWQLAVLDLNNYEGLDVQFRFVAKKGAGRYGDIAIDNINFYGPQLATTALNTYYLDGDNDGFGDDGLSLQTCSSTIPAGYVLIGGDCNDNDFNINPNAAEIPCNFLDDNCNGFGDENDLDPPFVTGDEICEGEIGTLQATANNPDAVVLWYESETALFPVDQGEFFSPQGIENIEVAVPEVLTYWVQLAVPPFCFADDRTPVNLIIYPNPKLVAQPIPPLCGGSEINLLDFVDDEKETIGAWFCYNENNVQLPSCQFVVSSDANFGVKKSAQGGCTDSISVPIDFLSSPIAAILGDTTLCSGDNQFLEGQDIGNGETPLTFEWNAGSSSNFQQIFSNTLTGSQAIYTLKITGANGCSSTDSISVTTIESIQNVSLTNSDVTVCNGNDGQINGEISGGTSPFTIQWFGETTGSITASDSTFVIQNLPQGAYALEISDASNTGCTLETPLSIINGPGAVVSPPMISPVSCAGGNDGCISISVTGVNPTIIWSNGSQNDTICNLMAGTYSVTVFDGNCQTAIENIVLPEPLALSGNALIENIKCAGQSNGSIEIIALGGTAPYTFNWSDGGIGNFRENLAVDTFAVTITDVNGCASSLANLEITEPAPLISSEQLTMPSCHGFNNGQIIIDANGGTPPYSIHWNNNAQGFNNDFLIAGNYSFTLTDANNCELTQSLVLPEPQELMANPFKMDATCNGLEDGAISLNISGGTAPFIVEWNNGDLGQTINGLPEGYYFAFVTDANNCAFLTDSIYVGAPNVVAFDALVQPAFCQGIDDGSIEIQIQDGLDYTFKWAHDSTSTDSVLTNLAAGNYFVTITNPSGCEEIAEIELPTTERISADIEVVNAACFGTASGTIVLNVTGENPFFDVCWSNGDTMTTNDNAMISDLAPGFYAAFIKDDLGCEKVLDSIQIDENELLVVSEASTENNSCFGGNFGQVVVDVEGGNGNYNFEWSNGGSTSLINENLAAGTYHLTVSDGNGCVDTSSYQITQPTAIEILSNLTDVGNCDPDLVDSLCVFISGGTAGYDILWNTGDTGDCLIGYPTGEYSLTVTDAAGCEATLQELKIPDPVEELTLTFAEDTLFLDCPDSVGDFLVEIDGGTLNYQYIWSHGEEGEIANDSLWATGLDAGACNVTVTDARGCVAVSDSFYIIRPDTLDLLITEIERVACKGGSNGEIQLSISGGTSSNGMYEVKWFENNALLPDDTLAYLENRMAGMYRVEVRDDNNCLAEMTDIEIVEPDSLLNVFPITRRDTICFDGDNGFINISPSGGYAPYSFMWSNGSTTEDLFNLTAGDYGLTMTDDGDCTFILPDIRIFEPDTLLYLQDSVVTHLACFGDANGTIEVNYEGSWPPYECQWIGSSVVNPTAHSQQDLVGDLYTLFVMDAYGCFADPVAFEIFEPEELAFSPDFSAVNLNEMTGTISLVPAGGTAPFQYLWADGNTEMMRQNLPYDEYSVTITDANNCEQVLSFSFDETTTSLTEIAALNALNLYPNPSNGKSYLEIEVEERVNFSLEIFDLLGKRLLSRQNGQQGSEILDLDLQNFPSGTYWIRITLNNQYTKTDKLILMN